MDGNYEWQRQQAQQRMQKRLQESQQHRLSKQQESSPAEASAYSIVRFPLRLVTAILSLLR